MSYIELTNKILFEIGGLRVIAVPEDRDGGAIVNDVLVATCYVREP